MKIDRRPATAERGVLVSLWGLLGMVVLKGTVGLLTGSKALLADACQSAADFAGAITSYHSLRKARLTPAAAAARPGPEAAVAVVLSAVLLVASFEIGLSSIKALVQGVDKAPGWSAVVLIVAGMTVREALVRYRRIQASRCGIRVERASEQRADIYASLTALVGASGALAGKLLQIPVLYVLDPAAGLVISVFVLRLGYRWIADALRSTDQQALAETDSQTLIEAALLIDGVIAVDDLKAREQGHYLVLDLTIRVNPRMSVFEGQELANRVRRHLIKRFLHVMAVNVSVQPYDPGYPYKSNHHEEMLTTLIQ